MYCVFCLLFKTRILFAVKNICVESLYKQKSNTCKAFLKFRAFYLFLRQKQVLSLLKNTFYLSFIKTNLARFSHTQSLKNSFNCLLKFIQNTFASVVLYVNN